MKIIIISIICVQILFFIKSIEILEKGNTKESADGYIIFNSKDLEINKDINFKIKAANFSSYLIKYYYFDEIQNFNQYEIDLFISEFITEKKEKQNDFEINYFKINKTTNELGSSEGNYLAIFYFTYDDKAEITHIQDNTKDEKEEKKLKTWEIIVIVVVAILSVVFIYCCCFKENKKKDDNNDQNINIFNNNDINGIQTYNYNNYYNNNFNSNQPIIPYNNQSESNRFYNQRNQLMNQIDGRVEMIKQKEIEQKNKMEQIKIKEREFKKNKLEQERKNREKEEEINQKLKEIKRKESILKIEENVIKRRQSEKISEAQIREEENLFNEYVEKIKQNNSQIKDIIIAVEGRKNPKELIHLVFQSGDQTINCVVICKNDTIFNNVINKVFEKEPKFKDLRNIFIGNGKTFNEYKSLKENNIKDGDVIIMYENQMD